MNNNAELHFTEWMKKNSERLNRFDVELDYYEGEIPAYYYKTMDNLILEVLDLFKKNKVDKPATTLLHLIRKIKEKIKIDHPLVDFFSTRMEDSFQLIQDYKNETDVTRKQELGKKLKERGLI